MKNRYRIVRDRYAGYEVQIKYWYFPLLWLQLNSSGRGIGINTNPSLERARALVRLHKMGGAVKQNPNYVIEYID